MAYHITITIENKNISWNVNDREMPVVLVAAALEHCSRQVGHMVLDSEISEDDFKTITVGEAIAAHSKTTGSQG
jgi:hypothetical protein